MNNNNKLYLIIKIILLVINKFFNLTNFLYASILSSKIKQQQQSYIKHPTILWSLHNDKGVAYSKWLFP